MAERFPGPAGPASQAASARRASGVISPRSAGQIIIVVTVETSDRAPSGTIAVAVVP
jgi:hypothetical protein